MSTIYFVGIGGSGMFPLASISIDKGDKVIGSDYFKSDKINRLIDKGAKIYLEHSEKNITDDIDLVVYSGAIKNNNPEIIAAKEKNIKCISRSKYLSLIMSKFKNSISVAGSHGKTTTTSMITEILLDSNSSPTSIIGGYFSRISGNSILGTSDIAVCEACEYMNSFLDLNSKIGIILNIDNDHLDYFKSIENEENSFLKFANKCEYIIVNKDDINSFDVSKKSFSKVIYYGIENDSNFMASNVHLENNGCYSFDVIYENKKLFNLKLKVPGKHNIYNSLASIAACFQLNIDFDVIKKSLEEFMGADRRFKFIGSSNGVSFFDDYAHHPTEIDATLRSAKSLKFNDIWLIFQPHTFSRTYFLLDAFVKSLSIADHVILTDILPVRETNIYGISSSDLSSKIANSVVISDFNRISDYIKINVKSGDMVMTMGAGDIYKCMDIIYNNYKEGEL